MKAKNSVPASNAYNESKIGIYKKRQENKRDAMAIRKTITFSLLS